MQECRNWQWHPFAAALQLGLLSLSVVLLLLGSLNPIIGVRAAQGSAVTDPGPLLLTRIQQIRDLSMDQARGHRLVELRGVVTYSDPEWNLLFIQDATAGVYIFAPDQAAELAAGAIITVRGTTDQGRYAAFVTRAQLEPRGASPMPVPTLASYADLMTGRHDSEWVEVRGSVTSATSQGGRAALGLNLEGHEIAVTVVNVPSGKVAELLDAQVLVRGVCAVQCDDQRRVKGIQILTPAWEEIIVEQKGVANEFAVSLRSIHDLATLAASSTLEMGRIQGVVDSWVPGRELMVRDRTGTIRVQTRQTNALTKDMLIDVVGKPILEKGLLQLVDATFRRLGLGMSLRPEELNQLQRTGLNGTLLRVLNRVELVRLLNSTEADQGYPIEIHGVVTYYDPSNNDCFVEDGTGGLWIEEMGTSEGELDLRAGDLVEVEGYSRSGYAPALVRPHFQIFGRGRLPNREPSSLAHLLTGREDGRWVEVIGLVRSIEQSDGNSTLNLEMGNGGRLKAFIQGQNDRKSLDVLLGATMQVRGVCATLYNTKRQLVGVRLLLASTNQLQILSESTADPKALPLSSIRELLQYQPRSQMDRRVRVHGVVTLVRPGKSLYIHDSSDGLLVETQETVALQTGDDVEVVGFPSVGDFSPVLQNAFCLSRGTGVLPQVNSVPIDEVFEGKRDSDLIRIDATYLETTAGVDDVILTMQTQERVFDAHLPKESRKSLPKLRPGALLRLTGVCSVQVDENRQPKAFRLLLRGPDDVELRKTPAAWIFVYASRLIGTLTVASLAALAWVVMLRNRVRRQTELIRQKLTQEVVLEQRYRDLFENANDLVFRVDLAGRWLDLNTAAERVFEMRRSEIGGKNLFDFVVPAHHQRVRTLIEKLEAGQSTGTQEVDVVGGNGKLATLEISARALQNPKLPTGIDCIARNITDRKRAEAELKETQTHLVQSSRLAGMAEVATSVLHNVGNVLNSVTVSTSLLAERTRQSKGTNVARAADILDGHIAELGHSLSQDSKVKELPGYLRSLGDYLNQENLSLRKEVASLHRNVEHIKEIVGAQQQYAKMSGAQEDVKLDLLIEDALQMEAAGLAKRQIQIIRDYAPQLGEIRVQKHKVLQILVNVIRNAQQACEMSGREGRHLTLRTSHRNNRAIIQVIDDGIGIPAENLRRIYDHGFTTRKDGHGFGLHSGVLAAREMGGALTVQSDGPGLGATSTLELPMEPSMRGGRPNGEPTEYPTADVHDVSLRSLSK